MKALENLEQGQTSLDIKATLQINIGCKPEKSLADADLCVRPVLSVAGIRPARADRVHNCLTKSTDRQGCCVAGATIGQPGRLGRPSGQSE